MADFQVGDKVRYTGPAGTVVTGEIRYFTDDYGFSAEGNLLYHPWYSERTVLLERPVRLKTEVGTMYRRKESIDAAVRMPDGTWLTSRTGSTERWLGDNEMEELLATGDWEEWA